MEGGWCFWVRIKVVVFCILEHRVEPSWLPKNIYCRNRLISLLHFTFLKIKTNQQKKTPRNQPSRSSFSGPLITKITKQKPDK